jgi:hypothetical protein
VPGELARAGLERVAQQLRLQRGVHRTEWGTLYCMHDRYVLGRGGGDECERVCAVPGRDVFKHGGSERVCFMPGRTHIFFTRNYYSRWMWMCHK